MLSPQIVYNQNIDIKAKIDDRSKLFESPDLALPDYQECETSCMENKCLVGGIETNCITPQLSNKILASHQKAALEDKINNYVDIQQDANQRINAATTKELNALVTTLDVHHSNSEMQKKLKVENIGTHKILSKNLETNEKNYEKKSHSYKVNLDKLDQLKKEMDANTIKKKKYISQLKYLTPILIVTIIVYFIL